MNIFVSHAVILFFATGLCLKGICQSNNDVENSDEPKIIRNWQALKYQHFEAPVLRFPQRKYDSPLFCDEFISYKNGIIINSMANSQSGRSIDVSTRYYYFNLETKLISKLVIPGVDTIESIISGNKNELFCSYIKAGKRVIDFLENGPGKNILVLASAQIRNDLDTSKWIKLGYRKGILYALSPVGAYSFSNNQWILLTRYSFAQLQSEGSKFRAYPGILPTRNISPDEGCIWFLQEIVQLRSCYLLKLDLKTGSLSDFFTSLDYTDNYFKQVNDYSILADRSILVSASRLLEQQLVLVSGSAGTKVWIFNNELNPIFGKTEIVDASVVVMNGDTAYLAGGNGLFRKYQETVTRVMYWENTHQNIIDQEAGNIDFSFFPRCLKVLSDEKILVGGMWGGLYLIDIKNPGLVCMDDMMYEKMGILDINHLIIQ